MGGIPKWPTGTCLDIDEFPSPTGFPERHIQEPEEASKERGRQGKERTKQKKNRKTQLKPEYNKYLV
ncbi:Uncharacterized protein APZ42_029810 [Daphnia magna]|uniref:Uncharacterized protein n=1 Tax=Daphnia magna TaxID=35525 RepID=A0A164PB86_9CRUS|nr:Uncharacterized protein APZ42_029810 [Daphnia magna]